MGIYLGERMNMTMQTPTPTIINGKEYYNVKEFAYLVRRWPSQIYMLFNHGNKVRKLKGERICGKPFIEASEVHEFPFDSRKLEADYE